ncbi:DUF4126 family protein [Streptomyces halstedii]|uniref:DUF4126 family protein n=1 Tax=Streptomyces TaxID=1883 RepID=UPI0004A89014|nr:DUF4126 family protein [Streptomyces sp. NTK 937]KDQ71294.1 hypothetical protein DT87_30090 [Streptomyces sp. NTK 937]WSX34311.1 DUF4126 family protein [Streptomyces halstedii]
MNPAAEALTRAVLIGAVSGLRSQWGMAAVAWSGRPVGASWPVRSWPARPWVRGAMLVSAAGEFVADKSPGVPSRLTPGGLVPRLVLGAVSGAALSRRSQGSASPVAAAAAGAVAAGAFACAGAGWRRAAGARTGDAVAAAVEDVLALALAWVACSSAGVRPPCRRTGHPSHSPESAGTGTSATDRAPDGPEE